MKKIFLYGTLLFAVWVMVSCQKEDEWGDGDGYVNLSIKLPPAEITRAITADAFDPFALRIYKTDGAKELIRHYHALKDVPARLWLKNGNYLVTVTCGDTAISKPTERVRTRLRDCCFTGEEAFEIQSGQATNVEVTCYPKETIIDVYFDRSIDATFYDYRVCAMVCDTFNAPDTINGTVPFYTFMPEKAKRVYILLPNDANTLSYCFWGKRSDTTDIHNHYKLTFDPDKRAGYCYQLSFKYSADAQGSLKFDVKINTDKEIFDDYFFGINPDPSPTVSGAGTEGTPLVYQGGETSVEYTLSSSAKCKIKSVSVKVGTATRATGIANAPLFTIQVSDPTQYEAEGITLDAADEQNVKLRLSPVFFTKYISGGESLITITARDDADQDGTAEARVLSSGVSSLASLATARGKWDAQGEIQAYVYIPSPTEVKIQYREKDAEEWLSYDATPASGNIYTAQVPNITGGHTYEYRLMVNGQQAGTIRTTAIANGWQIPNAGFELWETASKEMVNPYITGGEQWWDTGNHGSIKAGINVTTEEKQGKKGSAAYLNSQKAAILGIGKFAAGNIFVGEYLGTVGTNGVIGFGKRFTPDYRPKKVKFWYKGTVGTIDEADKSAPVAKNDKDVAQFYVLLCNMGGPHIVNTDDTSTFMNFDTSTISYCTNLDKSNSKNDKTDGHIVAKAIWENSESKSDWTLMEVTLEYTDDYGEEIPNYILVTASASKYGDYFTGSTASDMYIDEVTFEY